MTFLSEVLADSPWGGYRFLPTDNAVADNIGSGSDFAYQRTSKVTVGSIPAARGAGSSSIATLSSVPSGLTGNNVTIAFWVNMAASASGLAVKIGNVTTGWGVGFGNGAGMATLGGRLMLLTENVTYHNPAAMPVSGRHHVMVVRGAGNPFTIYIDGSSAATGNLSSPTTATGIVGVGGRPGAPTNICLDPTTSIDHVAIFAGALTSTDATNIYNGGTVSDSAVLALSPDTYLKLDDAPNIWDDASPNDRGIYGLGVGQPSIAAGPVDRVASWSANTYARSQASMTQPTTGTIEAIITIPGSLAGTTTIAQPSFESGTTGPTMSLDINPSFQPVLTMYTGSAVSLTGSALTIGNTYHIVASVGAAGSKIRVNKVTVASGATTAVSGFGAGCFLYVHGGYNGSSVQNNSSALKIAELFFYTTQLSDARTDVHYDNIPPNAYDTVVAADSSAGYWKLDELTGTTAYDSSGNGRHLTSTGATLNAAKVNTNGQSAYDFTGTGSSSNAQIASASWMNATDWTVLAYINPDATSSYRCIASRDWTAAQRGWSFYVTGGKLNVYDGTQDALGGTTLSASTGYQVAYTYVGSTNTVKLYVNGVLDGTFTRTLPNPNNPLVIGASYAGTVSLAFGFDGKIDDVEFVPTALSAARLLARLSPGSTGFLGTGTFSGSGTLTSTSVPAIPGTATLAGSGTLASTSVPAIPGTVGLSGSGTLAPTGRLTAAGVATLTGTGTLVPVGSIGGYAGTAGLSGTGSLTSTGSAPTIAGVAVLTGGGTLVPVGPSGTIVPIVVAGEPFILPVLAETGTAGLAAGTDTDVDPDDPDPSTPVDGTGFGAWTFIDPSTSDTYIFDTNPYAMEGVHRQLSINPESRSAVTGVAVITNTGPVRVTQGKRQPLEWTFSGNIRSREHYMAMRKWSHKHYRIIVVDHFGRQWSIQLQGVQYEEQKPNPRNAWRFRYVAHCTLYGRVGG